MTGFLWKMKRLPWRALVLVSLWSIVLVGCGESVPTGTVQGKVLLNDAPYADAAVVFLSPKTGNGGTADIQAGGTFRLKEPLEVGSYKVYLMAKAGSQEGAEGPTPVTIDESVPDKYWNEATTDITIEVTEGENNVTVTLSK
jgi:hypothetical protein